MVPSASSRAPPPPARCTGTGRGIAELPASSMPLSSPANHRQLYDPPASFMPPSAVPPGGSREDGGANPAVAPILPDTQDNSPPQERGFVMLPSRCWSAGTDPGRTRAFLALAYLELDLLALLERRVSLHPYLGMMDEQIVAALIRCDEPKPLVRIEPFDCTFCHVLFSLGPPCLPMLFPLLLCKNILFGSEKDLKLRSFLQQTPPGLQQNVCTDRLIGFQKTFQFRVSRKKTLLGSTQEIYPML